MTIDMRQYNVVVTFKNGKQMVGRCTGNPIACTPTDRHGIFDHPFLFLDTIVPLIEKPGAYDTDYRAMIRTEDIMMIQVKPLTDQAKKVTE